jgi:hypothetical protein
VGVTCTRCKKSLRAVDIAKEGFIVYEGDHSQLPTLYSGVVCSRCGKVECTNCRLGGMSRPCLWCGSKVEPAYDHALRRYRGAIPPATRLFKNAALLVLLALAAFAVQSLIRPRRLASGAAEAARIAEVAGLTDAEALAAVVRDRKEPLAARIEAVRRVGDDDLLEATARDESAPDALRDAAVKALAGQDALIALARDTDLEPAVREAAIRRLNDADVLRALAVSDSDYRNIQRAAQERLRRLETQ